jgi:F0F1-type ATP synthase membrane subunit b/b'
MHQYKIIATYYNEAGALTNEYEYKYADTPEQAKEIFNDYNKQKYESVDEEGNVTVGVKKFKVRLYVLARKEIEDTSAFFAQFEA